MLSVPGYVQVCCCTYIGLPPGPLRLRSVGIYLVDPSARLLCSWRYRWPRCVQGLVLTHP
jgi:hypothetical protein